MSGSEDPERRSRHEMEILSVCSAKEGSQSNLLRLVLGELFLRSVAVRCVGPIVRHVPRS